MSRARSRAPGWGATLREIASRVRRDRVSVSAGSLAYHGFLAFFPALIAALGVLTLVQVGGGTLQHLLHGISKALPSGVAGVLTSAVRAATKRSAGSATAVVVGVVVSLWSATSAMAVLQQVLDVAYEVPDDRKFIARRVRGLPLLALTSVVGGLAAALVVFGQPIGSAIGGFTPFAVPTFTVGWTVFRWVLAFVLISTLFSAYYVFGPNRERQRWRWVTPGSLLATAVFLLGSLGFSFFISTFGSYGKTYGSLAGVVIFILWIYLTSLAVLIGGELNAQLEREGRLATSPRTRRRATRSGRTTRLGKRAAPAPAASPQTAGWQGAQASEPGPGRVVG